MSLCPRCGFTFVALTPREEAVLDHLSQGMSNALIGEALGTVESTIKTHISHILRKLGVDGRAGAAYIALQRSGQGPNLLSPDYLLASWTTRQRAVLKLLAEGLSNKQIVTRLSEPGRRIGLKTVKLTVEEIFNHLGATSRTEATIFAYQKGLLLHEDE